MQTRIDLNADLGELDDSSLDAAVMPFISSCSIACGSHAGNPETMGHTVRLALKHGVAIGAHPGYPDLENFGRISMEFQTQELCSLIRDQILLLRQIAEEEGAALYHVKLHGALYNDLAFDYERSLAVSKTIAAIDPELRMIAFSGSETARAAEDAGLVAVHEVFADRAYTDDGKLMPRSEPGAVLHDEDDCLAQAERFVCGVSGVKADSICVHGDNPAAICFVSKLRKFFEQRKMVVAPSGRLDFSFRRLGERSLLAKLPARISKSTHRKIRSLQLALEGMKGIVELVPCYAELKVDFDPNEISIDQLKEHIQSVELSSAAFPEPRLIEVPVVYDGEDLQRVAGHNGLSVEEVIQLHSSSTYLVYMLGFSPGFPYLGGLNPKLTTPRFETPRVSVPAGAVGIAGGQTGVYPVESPGGWNIIGYTPLKLFDPEAENPFLFEPGDEVRFIPSAGGTASSLSGRRADNEDVVPPVRYAKIIEPGMYTTVQGPGRAGWLRYGVSPGGPMDRRAFRTANALLGNTPDAAVLECTGTMPVLEFNCPLRIAVVYPDRFQTLEVAANELAKFQPLETGYRAYIAVEGGFEEPGWKGGVLKGGDLLPIRDHGSRLHVAEVHDLGWHEEDTIRVIPGPEADWFDCGGLNTFLTDEFTVSSKSNRTGIRLDGPELSFGSGEQMVSAGIAMGTIQVPPSGRPIIMMADHPTTGGYPRIGNVVEEDLPILAQLRPGDSIRFVETRVPDATL